VVSDAELVCLAVAQALLRYPDEHHWLRAAPSRVGHLFPRLLSQPEYNRRLRAAADVMEAALRWLAGYGHDTSHHRFYWGAKLMLIVTPDGTVTGFGLAHPKLFGEREQVLAMLTHDKNLPTSATTIVCDKGFAGRDFENAMAGNGLTIVRPARKDEPDPGTFPNWLRQRVEAIIWTLRDSCTWKTTADACRPGCGPESYNDCWPSTLSFGTTGPSTPRSNAP
jgi:hypothetical protein